MSTSTYEIIAQFKGAAQIVAQFRQVQTAARQTTRALVEGAKQERQAVTEARRREREATREAMRAVNEAERSFHKMMREREKLRREDLAAQRRYLQQLKKERSDMEEQQSKGARMIVAGGIGLGITAGGIKIAAGFESSMTELRLAIARTKDGAVDMQLLNSQMAELEKLAVKLGNTLPGTTKDFVDLFISLKQGGMATQDILGGAGEAIANLAVLTHSEPAVLGKQFAQIGQMFKLKPEEYKQAVEQFHALYRMGVAPDELIESAKFFAPRAGAPLGMTGVEGMVQAGTLLGALNRAGLGGGIGGRDVSTMMTRLTMSEKPQQKMLAELKSKGVDLKFFDKKGQFAGLDNMVAQLEKLKKLSPEDQIEAMHKLFTEAGATAAGNILQMGVEGLRKYAEESRSIIDSQTAINDLQKTFAQRWENLTGTAQNVGVRLFTPLMDSLKPILEGVNSLLGSLEGLAKTNPEVAKLLTNFITMGSALLIARGALMRLTASYRIYQLTAAITAAENRTLAGSFATTGTAVTAAGTRVAGYRRQLGGIPGMIGTTVTLLLATETISYIFRLREEAKQAWEEAKGSAKGAFDATRKLYASPASGEQVRQVGQRGMASSLEAFLRNVEPERGVDWNAVFWNSLSKGFGAGGVGAATLEYKGGMAKNIGESMKQHMPELSMPSQMAFFLEALSKKQGVSDDYKSILKWAAQTAFPDSFKQYEEAVQKAAGDRTQVEQMLIEQDRNAARAMGDLTNATQNAATELGKIKVTGGPPALPEVPTKARGGYVTRSGMVVVHAGESIVPASVTKEYERATSASISVSYAPSFSFAGGADERMLRRLIDSSHDDLIAKLDEKFRDRELVV